MNHKKARANRPVRASSLFRRVLPENFRQKSATIGQFQQFFHDMTSDAVFPMVQVIDVSDTTITLALPSAALVNYLRLHGEELRRAIEEQFGMQLQLKIVTLPQSLQAAPEQSRLEPAHHFNKPTCDRVKKTADSVEDENLRAALLRLAQSMREEK